MTIAAKSTPLAGAPGMSANAKGALWLLIGTALFTLIFASGRFAGPLLAIPQILLLRYASGFVTLLVVAKAGGHSLVSLRSPRPGQHFLRACFGCFGGLSAIYAAAHMPVAAASAIGLLEGIFVVALAVVMLGETVGWRHWLAGLTCGLGALAVVIGQHSATTPFGDVTIPAAMALLGAVLMAFEIIYVKRLTKGDTPLSMLAHVNLFSFLLMLVPAWLSWKSVGPGPILACLMLGPVAILAQYCNIRGYRLADIAVAGPIGYSWIVFAALLGLLAFGEVPDLKAGLGCLTILAGGYWLTRLPATSGG